MKLLYLSTVHSQNGRAQEVEFYPDIPGINDVYGDIKYNLQIMRSETDGKVLKCFGRKKLYSK